MCRRQTLFGVVVVVFVVSGDCEERYCKPVRMSVGGFIVLAESRWP